MKIRKLVAASAIVAAGLAGAGRVSASSHEVVPFGRHLAIWACQSGGGEYIVDSTQQYGWCEKAGIVRQVVTVTEDDPIPAYQPWKQLDIIMSQGGAEDEVGDRCDDYRVGSGDHTPIVQVGKHLWMCPNADWITPEEGAPA